MHRLVNFSHFSQEISASPRLKIKLVWVTFIGLVFPTATLISLGFPEKPALILMLIAIVPFQYVMFNLITLIKTLRQGTSYPDTLLEELIPSIQVQWEPAFLSTLSYSKLVESHKKSKIMLAMDISPLITSQMEYTRRMNHVQRAALELLAHKPEQAMQKPEISKFRDQQGNRGVLTSPHNLKRLTPAIFDS